LCNETLAIHRRLQAGIDAALQRLPSPAKIETQGTVVTSRRRPRCALLVLGWDDVLPVACWR
jgi:hypothetical protein